MKTIKKQFKKFIGNFEGDDYNNKPIIDCEGQPLFAELAVLKILKKEGWDGFWIDAYRRKFHIAMPSKTEVAFSPPKDKLELLNQIWNKTGKKFSGSWDIFAWKGDNIKFIELKHAKKDKMRENQDNFYQTAISLGMPEDSFEIWEWGFEE